MRQMAIMFCAVLFLGIASFAVVPRIVNYQGRLTDTDGMPVEDGSYQLTFSIFDGENTGTQLWTSNLRNVDVTAGLFSYELGSNATFPESMFENTELWLEIGLGDPPIPFSDRTRITSNFYSMRAVKADTANFIDTLVNTLYFDQAGDETIEGRISLGIGTANQYADIDLYHNSVRTTKIFGDTYGELTLSHQDNGYIRADLAAISSGGRLSLRNDVGAEVIRLDGGLSSNDAMVDLPDASVNSMEILDEPGFVRKRLMSSVSIATTGVTNILSAEITVPGPGYVLAMGYGIGTIGGTMLGNALLGLELSPTATPETGHYTSFGCSNEVVSSYTTRWMSVAVERAFEVGAATTTTVYFNATRASTGGSALIYYPKLILVYYPTAYGDVTKLVSGAEVEKYDKSIPVEVTDIDGETSEIMYEVDMRELVLKTKEARIKALEAELELEKAKMRRQ